MINGEASFAMRCYMLMVNRVFMKLPDKFKRLWRDKSVWAYIN